VTTPTPSDGPGASAVQAPSGSCGVPGAVIGGRYTLHDPIGAGGMGAVWRAHDDLLRRDVAVKEVLLPPGIPAEERDAICERTLREARAAAGLSHPSVVQVYDVITHNDRPWIVMELLTARSVADMIGRNGPLPPRAIAKIGLSVLGALSAAHARGVLHRDVKPANVLICSDGRCVLTDFGVARIMADDGALTTPGMVLGSPQYISPERATGSEFGPPSDLFSLGVTLYTAAEGKPPFDRGDPLATMHAVVYEEPTPPRNAGPLTPILMGLLVKDPKQRWDVQRTRDELRAVLAGPLSTDTPQAAPQPPAAPAPPAQPGPLWPTQPGQPVQPGPNPPVPAQPMPGQPMPGQPMSGQPMSAQPVPPPVSAQPMSGQPMSGQPMSGQPIGPPPGPVTMRATAAVPSPPSQQQYYDAGYPTAPYGPAQPRRTGPWLLAAGAAAVVLLLVLVVVGAASGWFTGGGSGKGTKQTSSERTIPGTPIKDPQGRFSSVVPKGWKLINDNGYLQYADPKSNDAWIKFQVTGTDGTARQFLQGGANYLGGSRDYGSFHQIGLRSTTMAGHPAAELEYTLVQESNGQYRHGIWRVIVLNGEAYEVYMSVPVPMFKSDRPAYKNAVAAYALR
jgi:eukaryotic-like serine/threonine-protein kinase